MLDSKLFVILVSLSDMAQRRPPKRDQLDPRVREKLEAIHRVIATYTDIRDRDFISLTLVDGNEARAFHRAMELFIAEANSDEEQRESAKALQTAVYERSRSLVDGGATLEGLASPVPQLQTIAQEMSERFSERGLSHALEWGMERTSVEVMGGDVSNGDAEGFFIELIALLRSAKPVPLLSTHAKDNINLVAEVIASRVGVAKREDLSSSFGDSVDRSRIASFARVVSTSRLGLRNINEDAAATAGARYARNITNPQVSDALRRDDAIHIVGISADVGMAEIIYRRSDSLVSPARQFVEELSRFLASVAHQQGFGYSRKFSLALAQQERRMIEAVHLAEELGEPNTLYLDPDLRHVMWSVGTSRDDMTDVKFRFNPAVDGLGVTIDHARSFESFGSRTDLAHIFASFSGRERELHYLSPPKDVSLLVVPMSGDLGDVVSQPERFVRDAETGSIYEAEFDIEVDVAAAIRTVSQLTGCDASLVTPTGQKVMMSNLAENPTIVLPAVAKCITGDRLGNGRMEITPVVLGVELLGLGSGAGNRRARARRLFAADGIIQAKRALGARSEVDWRLRRGLSGWSLRRDGSLHLDERDAPKAMRDAMESWREAWRSPDARLRRRQTRIEQMLQLTEGLGGKTSDMQSPGKDVELPATEPPSLTME